MSADRWRQARLSETLEVLLARHRENFSPAEVREVEQAILALRESDQRGAAQAQVQEDVESLETAGQPVSATHLPASGPYKARQSTQNNHVAPDYVDGPNGFSALSYGAWELAEHLNRLLAAPHPDMVLVPRKTMRLIRLAFLPTNPNRMRAAAPDVVAAAREFVALAAAEEARNAT